MYFIEHIKDKFKNQKLDIYVDMDGVVADYNICDNPYNFKDKRPLYTNINTIKKLSELDNVNIYILSVCIKDTDILDKTNWLEKYCDFIKKTNINILSKESIVNTPTHEMKCNFLNNLKTNNTIILIDDDNNVLHYVRNNSKITVYQDSSLLD